MQLSNNQQAFLTLVRAGLWEKDVQLATFGQIDFNEVYRLAEEQSVVGLVAAGLERVKDVKVPQEVALTYASSALQLEQRNLAMNLFIASIIEKMRLAGIYTLLVKGQGIAQCYERPLWRAAGDVDLFLSEENYNKASYFLKQFAIHVEDEGIYDKHLAMEIDTWEVELHGTLRTRLWSKVDRGIDEVQYDVFCGGSVRSWTNGKTQVFLPGIDEDVVFVFTHILQHFFLGGIGIRQVCDLCRLLWTYKDRVNILLLSRRLTELGLLTEWKAFASLAVNVFGMPCDAIPLYSDSSLWKRRSKRILHLILKSGNFGHNRDISYFKKYPYITRKFISFWHHNMDFICHFTLFPCDSLRVWGRMIKGGFNAIMKMQ